MTRMVSDGGTRAWLIRGVAVAGLVGILVGYQVVARRNPVAAEPEIGAVESVRSPSQIVLPLDAYRETLPVWRARQTAIDLVGRDCMRQLGFDWAVPKRTPPATAEPENARRYGLIDAGHATRNGYRRDPAEEAYTLGIKELSRQVSEAANRAWLGEFGGNGPARGGCREKAANAIGGDPPRGPHELVQRLKSESFARSSRDSRVRARLDAWAACMHERGYPYQRPMAAAGDERWLAADRTVSVEEIAVATADVECNHRADLAGVWLAVESAHQTRMIESHAEELNEMKRWLEQVGVDAARVVSGR